MSMQIKRGDLEPALVVTVEDAGGAADLNAVTSWRVIGTQRGLVVVDGAPTSAVVDLDNSSKAVLIREWVAGETAVAGEMRVEVEALWPGNRPQTFPATSTETVRINADLA